MRCGRKGPGIYGRHARLFHLPRAAHSGPPAPPMLLREALAIPAYRAALGSAFANGWCNFGVRVAVIPQFALVVRDDTWVAGVALALAALGTAATLQVAGRLADTLGRRSHPKALWSEARSVIVLLHELEGAGCRVSLGMEPPMYY